MPTFTLAYGRIVYLKAAIEDPALLQAFLLNY
jgi:hypothetical protein